MNNTNKNRQSCYFFLALISIGFSFLTHACRKGDDITPRPPFTIVFDNEYNLLRAKYGAFITAQDGKVAAFRWLNGNDTTHVGLRFSDFDHYDCTIIKITPDVNGSNLSDVELITYHQVAHNTTIHLRQIHYAQEADLKIQFKNVSSLDTMIFPISTSLIEPRQSNNYFGNFKVDYTGDFWLLGKFNGEQSWRYLVFKNFSPTTNTFYIDQALMPKIQKTLPKIKMPFGAHWQYYVEGIIDIDNQKVFPLCENINHSLTSIPLNDTLTILQPDDLQANGYRIKARGVQSGTNGYTYDIDRYYSILPSSFEQADFFVEPGTGNNTQKTSVKCTGNFDALVVTRSIAGTPNIHWSVYLPPSTDGIVTHTLPEVPEEVSDLFPRLGTYTFDPGIKVRAERYRLLFGFEDVQFTIFENADAFWQPKNELLAVERVF